MRLQISAVMLCLAALCISAPVEAFEACTHPDASSSPRAIAAESEAFGAEEDAHALSVVLSMPVVIPSEDIALAAEARHNFDLTPLPGASIQAARPWYADRHRTLAPQPTVANWGPRGGDQLNLVLAESGLLTRLEQSPRSSGWVIFSAVGVIGLLSSVNRRVWRSRTTRQPATM